MYLKYLGESFIGLLVLLGTPNLTCPAKMITAEPGRAAQFCLHWVISGKEKCMWAKKNFFVLLTVPADNRPSKCASVGD
jgi:hypothetical protein